MAYNTIFFKNPYTGQIREAPVGFSWTCLFFGFLPAFFRSDLNWGAAMIVCALITAGLCWFIFPFIYNKIYIKGLVNNGYKVNTTQKGSKEQLELNLGVTLDSI